MNKAVVVFLIIAGYLLFFYTDPISRGIFSFFYGGAVYYLYLNLLDKKNVGTYVRLLGIISTLLALAIPLEMHFGFFEKSMLKITHIFVSSDQAGNYIYQWIIIYVNPLLVKGLFFPTTILFLALVETLKGAIGKQFAFIGHISFSSYLIHFPLQLMLMIICDKYDINKITLADSPITLIVFYIVLVGISLLSFKYFEMPAQTFLRKKLIQNLRTKS